MKAAAPHDLAPRYIAEVDGLRAVAVLAVIVYHAVPKWLPGGYAGVDVFFVISGYLITRLIITEHSQECFNIWRFWERRVRRIVPPVIVLIAVSGVAAWLWFTPGELAGFAASAVASLLSAANLYFWQTSGGYFAVDASRIPLLHMWSLGVEEQFYLTYPLLLLPALGLPPRALKLLLVAAVIACFAVACYTAAYHPVAAFFLPFSRAWELGAGGALALWPRAGAALGSRARDLICLFALVVLGASFALVRETTLWPGPATTPIIAASAVLIALAPGTRLSGGLLASRPFVAVGMVSYGTYLWHHVLLAFARIIDPDALPTATAVGLLFAAFAAGAASYVLIEQPARNRRLLPPKLFWPFLLLPLAVLLAAGVWIWRTAGAPERLPQHLREIAAMSATYPAQIDRCFLAPGPIRSYAEACVRGESGAVRTALVGDSHAMALAPGFDPLLARTGTRMRLLSAAGCPPIDDGRALSSIQAHCPARTQWALENILADDDIRLVVIAARWPYQFERTFYDNGEGGVEIGPPDPLEPNEARDRLFEASLRRVVAQLRAGGKSVALVYSVPEPGWDVPKYLVHSHLLTGEFRMPTIDEVRWRAREAASRAMLDRIPSGADLVRIDPAAMICTGELGGRCRLGDNVTPFYFDDDHPNVEGARAMVAGDLRRRGAIEALAFVLGNKAGQLTAGAASR